MLMGFSRIEISERRVHIRWQFNPFGQLFDDRHVRGIQNDKAQKSITFCTAVIQAVRFMRNFVEIMALSRQTPSRSSRYFCCLSAWLLIDKLKNGLNARAKGSNRALQTFGYRHSLLSVETTDVDDLDVEGIFTQEAYRTFLLPLDAVSEAAVQLCGLSALSKTLIYGDADAFGDFPSCELVMKLT
jgi:hypothetical protein